MTKSVRFTYKHIQYWIFLCFDWMKLKWEMMSQCCPKQRDVNWNGFSSFFIACKLLDATHFTFLMLATAPNRQICFVENCLLQLFRFEIHWKTISSHLNRLILSLEILHWPISKNYSRWEKSIWVEFESRAQRKCHTHRAVRIFRHFQLK